MRGWLRAISGKHVAGNPNVVVRNMQGAGSVIAANYVFNVSPKDGLELGLFAGNIVIDPLIGGTQHKYDAQRVQLDRRAVLGFQRLPVVAARATFKTIDDVLKREMITGTVGHRRRSTSRWP